jgi:protein-disulfide isomerase
MERDTKIFIVIGVITLLIIVFGSYFLSKPQTTGNLESGDKSDASILVRADSSKATAKNEKAVLVEFGDFECPSCATYHLIIKKLMENYKENLTFVFRNFPLDQHKNALLSAYAAEAARLQNKYWEMHYILYEKQDEWASLENPNETFLGYAKDIGLDINKFNTDKVSDAVKNKVSSDSADGNLVNITSTPTFFLNSERLGYPKNYEEFEALIKKVVAGS